MEPCKYACPETYSDMKVWMAMIRCKSSYACTDESPKCSACIADELCVCNGEVYYKGVSFIRPGEVEWTTSWYDPRVLNCCKHSTGARHLQWRFIPDLPHKGFLLIQKIVRQARQNLFKVDDNVYWTPVEGYTVCIDDSEWHECSPILDKVYVGKGTYIKKAIGE